MQEEQGAQEGMKGSGDRAVGRDLKLLRGKLWGAGRECSEGQERLPLTGEAGGSGWCLC